MKKEEEEEDRISSLPDFLVIEILSRLPSTKHAIRTCCLSKRWQHVWTFVPNLIFYIIDDADIHNFFSFADKTLTQCCHLNNNLNKFKLFTSYDVRFVSHLNNLIRYAIRRNVQQLDFIFWTTQARAEEAEPGFVLKDELFFVNSCFTDLKLAGCVFNPTGRISWKKLKSLCITQGKVDEHLIQSILSGSPLLETLKLENCFGYSLLDITSKSVKNLVFSGYENPAEFNDNVVDVVKINAPYILSLTIQGCLSLWKLLLLNVSSLVEASLDYHKDGYYETTAIEAEEEMLKGFILNLCHVNELQIGGACHTVLSRLKAKGFVSPSNLKVLSGDWFGN